MLLAITFGVGLAAWLVRANIISSEKDGSSESMKMGAQEKPELPKDPCWFASLKDQSIPYEMIKARQDREMNGYPKDTPLSEAINIFNEEKQCSTLLAPYPALTEEELMAAIVAGADYELQAQLQAQKDALWKIATRKIMPKGSLLVATSGSRIQESPLRPDATIRAEGISIYILLGLETNEYGKVLSPEQRFLIRKTYSRVETIK